MYQDDIDRIEARLQSLQEDHALTDRAVAAAIKLFVSTGDFPDLIDGNDEVEEFLLDMAWLLFLAAPAEHPRYMLVSSMHLGLVLNDDRDLASFFEELRTLDSSKPLDGPQWLQSYRKTGAKPLPDDHERQATIKRRFARARQLLQEHHEAVVEFSQGLIDQMTEAFDDDVAKGQLSPLGDPYTAIIDDIDDAIEDADQRQQEGDLVGAKAIYSAVLDEQSDHLYARTQRGVLRAALENLDGAIDDFDAVLEADEDHLMALLNRGLARHSLGDIDAALNDYNRALEQVDDNPELWTNRGIAHFSNQSFDAALNDFNRAIDIDDQMAEAYFQRANVHRVLGDVGRALNDYASAIELRPDFVDAYSARGFLFLQMEDVDQAFPDLNRAIELQPSDAALYYNRAHAHLLADAPPKAIDDYSRALELDPEDVEALANRGAAKMMEGDLDGAVDDWETAIAINPYYPTPYLKRASMWIATEHFDEAIQDLQIALDNAPNDWPYSAKVEETLQDLLADHGDD